MTYDKEKTLKAAEKFIQQNNLLAAVKEYEKLVAAEPQNLIMLNTLGDLCVRANLKPQGIKHLLQVAESYNRDGFGVKAIAMYKKINKLDPTNEEVGLKLAELYCQQKHMVDARQQYAIIADVYKNKGQTTKALKILKTIADLDPNNISLRAGLAESFEREGQIEEAHDAYLQIGQEHIKRNEPEAAITAIENALSIKPDSKIALKSLVELLAQQGALVRAVEMIGRLLGKNPDDVDLVIILGRTFLNANMLAEAEMNFAHLLELDNSRADYLLEVARRYLEEGNFDQTINIVDRCVDILIERRQHRKATAILKTVLKRDAYNILALKRLGYIYFRLQENRTLIATLKLLIQTALKLGMQAEAIMALEQLIQLEPEEDVKSQLASLSNLDGGSSTSSSSYHVATDPLVETFYPLAQKQKEVEVPVAAASEPTDTESNTLNEVTSELLESMVKQHPEFLRAQVKMLEDLVAAHDNYLEARLKLRKLYLDLNDRGKAAHQCQEIARIYDEQGDAVRAKEYRSEGFKLNLLLDHPMHPEAAPAAETAAETAAESTEQISAHDVAAVFNDAEAENAAEAEPVAEELVDDDIEIEQTSGEHDMPAVELNFSNPTGDFAEQLAGASFSESANFNVDISAGVPANLNTNFNENSSAAEPQILFDAALGVAVFSPEQQSLFVEQLLAERALDREWRRAVRYHQPISLIVIEIDEFPEYTNFYGQRAGKELVERMQTAFTRLVNRPGDEVFNFGGEFAVMLPDTGSEGAVTVAEKLRQMVLMSTLPHEASKLGKQVTLSCGVATALPKRDTQMNSIINTAVKALDKVKNAGRNNVLTA